MRARFRMRALRFTACGLLAAAALGGYGQEQKPESPVAPLLPDAPGAHAEPGSAAQPDEAAEAAQTTPAPGQPGSSSSGPGSSAQNPGSASQAGPESQHQEAAQQLKEQEKQRLLGVVPNFNVTYQWNAAPLSAGQKMQLAFRSAIDPFTFAAAGVVAGMEAIDHDPQFGTGLKGYGERTGAAYLDSFDGDIIGNGILPAVLRQDPRYFRLGHGSVTHRLLYAIMTSYVCRGDNGHWQPNYSNVGGNIIAGAISNLYYPSQSSGWGQTISHGFIVTTEGTAGGVLDEFWPDISRKLFHKNPTGADAAAPGKNVQPARPAPGK